MSIEQLADDIVQSGARMAFGVPGSGITLSLIDALEQRGIPFHLSHFEGAGALMAATSGRLTGAAGVSLSIKGPGLTNALPGIAAAHYEAFPLVHLAEAYAPGSSPAQAHKRLDQATLCSPVTKAVRHRSRSGPGYDDLARLAVAEEPGPVLLELAPQPTESQPDLPEAEAVRGDLAAALDLIRGASRPVVIAGALAVRASLSNVLASLACPVFSTCASKGVIDEALPHAAGLFTGVGLELTPEWHLLPQADLVIGIGLTARESLGVKPFPCPFIAVEAIITPGSDGFAPAATVSINAINDVLAAINGKAWGQEELAAVLAALHARMDQGFLPGAVFHLLDRHFGRRARMVLDTGYFCTIGEHALSARASDLCLMSGQGRYMGTGIPMAVGAALTDPATPAVAVLGDGGIAMYLAEARLAAKNRLPLLFVLMTDNSFSSIRTRALKDNLTQKPLVMDGRGWTREFEAMGIPATRAENLNAVEAALAAWSPASGPAYLEIPFEPVAYEAMVAGIR